MKNRIVIDDAIGEMRAAVYEGRQCVELHTQRWSLGQQPQVGDVYAGRVRTVDKSLEAAFIDLGTDKDGFLRFNSEATTPHLKDGHRIIVEVTRRGMEAKGPVVKYRDDTEELPGLKQRQSLEQKLLARYPGTKIDYARVNTVEAACQRTLSVPGGGDVCFEQTRALLAIDIDKGSAVKNLDVCLSATDIIAQQMRLRGLGGLVIIDYPNLRQPKQRQKLMTYLDAAFINDPATTKFLPMSRFGVVEMTRSKQGPSLDEIVLDTRGELTVESQSLQLLQRCEREARQKGGAQITIIASDPVMAWLEDDIIDWRAALTDRIGARFDLVTGKACDIKTDR